MNETLPPARSGSQGETGAGVYDYAPGEVERIPARRNAMLIDFIKVLKKHPPLRAPEPKAG